MAFKVRVKSPSLMDLVEVDKSRQYSISNVAFGKASDMGKIIVKRAVAWKGVKNEAYKKNFAKQYEHQQAGSKAIREEAVREYKTGSYGPIALVQYNGAEYGIMPTVSALMNKIKVEKGIGNPKNKKVIEIVGTYPTKEAALAELRVRSYKEYEEAIMS